ncbi:MAG: tyrosine-type recombinase/integrase [Halobacteriota archaeon]
MRLSFAIHRIRSSCDLRRLQQLLAHSSIQTTIRYLQFKDSELLEASNRVGGNMLVAVSRERKLQAFMYNCRATVP